MKYNRSEMRVLLLLPILAGMLSAQIDAEAMRMLQQSSVAIEKFQAGKIETDITGIYARTSQPLTIRASLQWSAPDKVRLEIGSGSAGEITVSDGHTLTKYSYAKREYSRHDGTFQLAVALARTFAGLLTLSKGDPGIVSARILRDDVISAGESRFNCSVLEIEVRPGQPAGDTRAYILWVDKTTGVPLRQQLEVTREEAGRRTKIRSSIVVRGIALNGPVDDEVFRLDPPPGSKQLTPGR